MKPKFLLDLEDSKRVKGITEPLEEDTPGRSGTTCATGLPS